MNEATLDRVRAIVFYKRKNIYFQLNTFKYAINHFKFVLKVE